MSAAEPAVAEAGALRPRVVVSECLGFSAVRYNGRMLNSAFVSALRDRLCFLPVCPEVGIGLGVPRDPIHIVRDGAEERLVQPSTGRDLTAAMESWSEALLDEIGPVDGFLLKSRSPSCGIDDVKRFPAGAEQPLGQRGPGVFARAVLAAHPGAAVEDEASLADPAARHHFLTHVYTSARFGEVRASGAPAALTRFHAEHELLLTVRDPEAVRRLGRIAAGEMGEGDAPGRIRSYGRLLGAVLKQRPSDGRIAGALDHLRRMLSDEATEEERERLRSAGDRYRSTGDPLPLMKDLVLVARRHRNEYVARQRILRPYPAALVADRA